MSILWHKANDNQRMELAAYVKRLSDEGWLNNDIQNRLNNTQLFDIDVDLITVESIIEWYDVKMAGL